MNKLFSLKYSTLLALGLAAIFVFYSYFVVTLPPQRVNNFFTNLAPYIREKIHLVYPSELVINVKNGIVSTNQSDPYCLPFTLFNEEGSLTIPGIIFDSKATSDYNLFLTPSYPQTTCKPIVVVGRNFYMYYDNQKNRATVNTISSDISFTVTKQVIQDFATKYLPILEKSGRTLYIVAPFILTLLLLWFWMFLNIWYTIVLIIVNRITKLKPELSGGQIYSFSLAMQSIISFTLNFLLGMVAHATRVHNAISSIPLFASLLVVVAFIFTVKTSQPAAKPVKKK